MPHQDRRDDLPATNFDLLNENRGIEPTDDETRPVDPHRASVQGDPAEIDDHEDRFDVDDDAPSERERPR